jgi:uncharacterized iron-regulated membrane protein
VTSRSFRNGLQTVHLWTGILLSLPFVLLGLSGSILMLQPEEPKWSMPHARARGEAQTIEAILAAAASQLPDARATRIDLPEGVGEPATIRFEPQDGDAGGNYRGDLVFVDPVSLEILGQMERPRPAQLFGIMRTLHATLYVRTISDRSFVGWMGIALIFICISGIVLWWPRPGQWRHAFGVKLGARGFRLHRDLHSAVGFWTMLVLLVVSFSGLYLAFPRTFRDGVGLVLPLGQVFSEPETSAPPASLPLDLDAAVALALSVIPDAEARSVQMPSRRGGVMVMTFAPKGYGARAPEITVSSDLDAGRISYVDDPRAYAVGERVVTWQRWLHSGFGLGLVWRVLVFISGFLPLFLAVTGIWMWALKRNQRAKVSEEAVSIAAQ